MRLIVNRQPIDFTAGDSVLIAMLRVGIHPTGGGCLCLGGDCPHCLATVDGVSYIRTCQVPAQPGMVVERHPGEGYPPLPFNQVRGAEAGVHYLHCDIVVIGTGQAGQTAVAEAKQAGKRVVTLDAKDGQEVVGIYEGQIGRASCRERV